MRLDEFKADKGINSGVFLRTPLNPSDPSVDCYELNIAPPDNPFPTGSLVARSKHELKSESTGWQNFHVTVSGGEITVVLNGQTVGSTEPSCAGDHPHPGSVEELGDATG